MLFAAADGGGALVGAASVSAGGGFACARAVGGATAWCWGIDNNGQLGDGGTVSTNLGAVVVANPGTLGGGAAVVWAEVEAYSVAACGLAAGVAYCWGSASYVGSTGGDTTVPEPVAPAASPKTWARLGAGGVSSTALAVAADTTLYGWGAPPRAPSLPGAAPPARPRPHPARRPAPRRRGRA